MDCANNVGVAAGDHLPFGVEVAPDAALLFFDVDGTLVWMDDSELEESDFTTYGPSDSVRAAFERLHARGHHAFLCTGRPLSFVPDSVMSLGFTGCITGAGACISRGREIIHEEVIERDLVLEAAQHALMLETPVMFESRETTVVVSKRGESLPGFPEIPVARTVGDLERIAPNLRFCKLCTMFTKGYDTPEAIEGFRAYVRRNFTECNMGLAYEFSPVGVNKGTGIERVLGMLGRDTRGTYAFGDSENDLAMFDAVETPVAMENAMDVLKERAAYVTGHAGGDGIASALSHFGLA